MPIYYKATERANPADRTAPTKYYATATDRKPVDLKTIAQSISDKSTTVSHVDVQAVLLALTDEIRTRLLDGENVYLGDLGYLSVTLKSKGADRPEDVNASLVEAVRVRFNPGKDLEAGLASAEIKKAPTVKAEGGNA